MINNLPHTSSSCDSLPDNNKGHIMHCEKREQLLNKVIRPHSESQVECYPLCTGLHFLCQNKDRSLSLYPRSFILGRYPPAYPLRA